jgi:cytidylate kinase
MYSVYTISRQYGSGGSRLAIKLSQLSGYELVWREIINQTAIKIGSPDMALAVIDELGLLGISPNDETRSKYRDAIQQAVTSKAEKGKVIIVGRASQIILKDFSNCLHIKVIASLETRIKNVHETKNVNVKAAKAQIVESDRNRQDFIKKFYQENWNDPSLYDLTINTDHFDLDSLANWIIKI